MGLFELVRQERRGALVTYEGGCDAYGTCVGRDGGSATATVVSLSVMNLLELNLGGRVDFFVLEGTVLDKPAVDKKDAPALDVDFLTLTTVVVPFISSSYDVWRRGSPSFSSIDASGCSSSSSSLLSDSFSCRDGFATCVVWLGCDKVPAVLAEEVT